MAMNLLSRVITGNRPSSIAGLVGEGRGAVEHDAGTHPVAMGLRVAQHGGGIGQTDRQLQALRGFAWNRAQLPRRSPLSSSARAKWVIRVMLPTFARRAGSPDASASAGIHAEAAHAGVDLSEDIEALAPVCSWPGCRPDLCDGSPDAGAGGRFPATRRDGRSLPARRWDGCSPRCARGPPRQVRSTAKPSVARRARAARARPWP
jgi:hypothetical protein